MIDHLVSSDENKTRSTLFISEENLFTDQGHFTSSGLVENMAQTAALRLGVASEKNDGDEEDPKIGYIGALKNLEIKEFPKVSEEIQTEVKVVSEIMNFQVVEAHVFLNDHEIASAELKIFLAEER